MQTQTQPVLSLEGISRTFGGSRALCGVDMDIHAGEVHGLLGQNGAGKSTIVKILSGADQPSAGTIRFGGEPVTFARPIEAQRAGIHTIFQEFSLVPGLSVAENIYLSDLPIRFGMVDWPRMRRLAAQALNAIGFGHIDVDARVTELSVAERQIVEIAKAVHHSSRVILLDEPTATLPRPDVEKLFALLRRLTARGVSLLYITHHLDEVMVICDRVSILRNGRNVASHRIGEITKDRMVALMLGVGEGGGPSVAGPGTGIPALRPLPDLGGHAALEIRHLSDATILKDINIRVLPGEAVAVTGLVGSGQQQLAACAFGARRRTAGEVLVNGKPVRPNSPRAAVRAGLGWVPEERKTEGLVLGMSVSQNLTIASLDRVSRAGVLDEPAERRAADRLRSALKIKTSGLGQPVSALSGGNQQKIVFGKWLLARSRALILSDPTRGVDVGARAEIYREIEDFLQSGGAALVLTSDIDEAMLFDRIMVISRGRIIGEFAKGQIDHDQLIASLQ